MSDNAKVRPPHDATAAGPGTTVDFGFREVPTTAKKPMVRAVFDSVAPKYDLMNDLMSLGIHRAWKRAFVQALGPRPGLRLLDLAGGTGDVSFGWRRAGGGPAILSDINAAMLAVGHRRAVDAALIGGLRFLVADAERLPLPDRCVDRVSMAFGLRNCTDKDAVLRRGSPRAGPGRPVPVPGVLAAYRSRRWRRSIGRGRSGCCRGWARRSPAMPTATATWPRASPGSRTSKRWPR